MITTNPTILGVDSAWCSPAFLCSVCRMDKAIRTAEQTITVRISIDTNTTAFRLITAEASTFKIKR